MAITLGLQGEEGSKSKTFVRLSSHPSEKLVHGGGGEVVNCKWLAQEETGKMNFIRKKSHIDVLNI